MSIGSPPPDPGRRRGRWLYWSALAGAAAAAGVAAAYSSAWAAAIATAATVAATLAHLTKRDSPE
jgi:predicted RecA/RadA family phage recombinase